MKTLFFALFLSLSTFSFGQEEFKSMATFDFLTASMSQSPRLNVGYIQKMNKNIWLGIDVGYGFGELDYGPITPKYQLFEIRPEIYYDLRPNTKLKHVLSFEGFYIHHKDTFKNSSFEYRNQNYKYSKADYKRIKIGANLNYNLMYYFGKRWGLMQKVGLGLRHRNTHYSNVEGLTEGDDDDGLPILSEANNYKKNIGSAFGLNFNLAFRFFYKF